jgi:hypothetical protein
MSIAELQIGGAGGVMATAICAGVLGWHVLGWLFQKKLMRIQESSPSNALISND